MITSQPVHTDASDGKGATVAVEQVGEQSSIALAIRDNSPRAVAQYMASLKPILASATEARGTWVHYVLELTHRDDLASSQAEIARVALTQSHVFSDARRQLSTVHVPPGFEPMHRAVEAWLAMLARSCDAVVRSSAPLDQARLERLRDILREAGAKADQFNEERSAAVQALHEAQRPGAKPPGIIASTREIRIVAIVLISTIVVSFLIYLALNGFVLPGQSTPLFRPPAILGGGTPGAGIERRTFPLADIQNKLQSEISGRRVAFQSADVKLVAPDRIIVNGKVQGPSALIPVEAELEIGITDAGLPRVTPKRLSAIGVQVPPEAFEAFNKRVEEANRDLAGQLAPGQFLRRLYIENNQIIADVDVSASTTPTKPAANKPGG